MHATIKQRRLELGLTQLELAQESGFTQVEISRWESGKRLPNVHQLQALSKVLGEFVVGQRDFNHYLEMFKSAETVGAKLVAQGLYAREHGSADNADPIELADITREVIKAHGEKISSAKAERILRTELVEITPEPTIILEGVFLDVLGWIKAVGILRLLQHTPLESPRLGWFGAHACIEGLQSLDIRLLPTNFRPTPVLSPWNSGSAEHALDLAKSIGVFPDLIKDAEKALALTSIKEKRDVITAARSTLSDDAVEWIDACVWETRDEELYFNGILGSGGNEGRLDYSRAYLRAVESLYAGEAAEHRDFLWEALLSGAELAQRVTRSFKEESCGAFGRTKNPWEVIAFIEGAIVLGSSVTQRLGSNYRHPTSMDPGLNGEGNRGDLWLPLWEGTTTLQPLVEFLANFWKKDHPGTSVRAAIKASIGEGQSRSFVRGSILQRNGQSHMICRI